MKIMNTVLTIIVVISIALLVACGTTPAQQQVATDDTPAIIIQALNNVPEDSFRAVGVATHNNRNIRTSTAIQRARSGIMFQMETLMMGMATDFFMATEAAPDALLQFSSEVSVALARQTISTREVARADVGGEAWIVLELRPEGARAAINATNQAIATIAPHAAIAQNELDRMFNLMAAQGMGPAPVIRD